MNQRIVPGYGDECPICHGTGWEIYTTIVRDYGKPEKATFTRPCTRCIGIRRNKDNTGIPEKYHDADFEKFDFSVYQNDMRKMKMLFTDFVKNFERWDKNGKGLYLWSKTPGSGKTLLACCLARSLMLKYDLQMRFITAPDYINIVGDSYKRERGEENQSTVYQECKLLVLDDIGAQIDKEWQRQEMFSLINKRMEKGNITIYTSNMCTDVLNVDDRTKDRIVKSSVELQMPEESIRRKKAKREQDLFLKEVLK